MSDETTYITAEETPETGVSLSVDAESGESGGAQKDIDADTGESGYIKETLGDEDPEEEVKEPRDNYDHYADHTFHNNVTMAGTLRAKRFVHPFGCLFRSKGKLLEELPNPKRGWWAMVGAEWPLTVYVCKEDGKWSTNREYRATGTDTYLTETDYIESVTDNGDGTYTLFFREQYAGYVTSQIEHNILKGEYYDVTDLTTDDDAAYTDAEPTARTSWMNVLSVDNAANTALVKLYSDAEISEDHNCLPRAGMKAVRVGNSGDSSNPRYAKRQSCLYMAGSDGRIVKLFRVTKPIFDNGMTAVSIGTIPDFITDLDPRLEPGDDGVVADTVVARRFITVDSIGRPVATTIDRGPWKPGERYYDGSEPNDNGIYERSLTYRLGHGWLNNLGGIATGENSPSWKTTYWTHVVGDQALHLQFCEVDAFVDPDDPICPMSVQATYMGEDVTDSPAIYYDWARVSMRQELEDTASDSMWTEQHRNAGPALTLDADDLNFQFGTQPDSCRIIVTATLHDPNNPNLLPQQAEYTLL